MSGIQWTNTTWNPVTGCTRVSAGCDNCYAVQMSHRLEMMGQTKYAGLTVVNGQGDRHFNGKVKCHEFTLKTPLSWKKPSLVFVNSMSDLFHDEVPFDFIDQVFAIMALCAQHTFQVLTKRPERMAEYFDRMAGEYEGIIRQSGAPVRMPQLSTDIPWPLPNVWLGTSCEDQAAADERTPHLLQCPAAVRFLSCEPLIGGIDFEAVNRPEHFHRQPAGWSAWWPKQIHWVIVGGESGKGARLCKSEWLRSIVGQCRNAEVPVFVKQVGSRFIDDDGGGFGAGIELDPECLNLVDYRTTGKGGDPSEWPEDLRVRQWPAETKGGG